jgi:drug/metabolite transporter (DMT)-like permease
MAQETTEENAGAVASQPANWVGYALLLSCVVVWGISSVAFKTCAKPPSGPGFDALFFTGVRFTVVAPLFALVLGLRDPQVLRLAPGDWKKYAVFGFVAIVLAESLQALALRYTSVANVTLLSHGTLSLFTALWALLLFKQRIAPTGWYGAALALFGVGLVAAFGHGGGLRFDADTMTGNAISLFRSVEHSCYLLMLSQWLQKRSAVQVTIYNCVFGALWLLPYTLWKGFSFPWGEVTPVVWLALFWTIVPTTLYAFLAWNWAMGKVGAIAATNMFYLMPLSAAVAAWALLGETITVGQVIGGIVIIVGIVLLRWEALVATGFIRLPESFLRLPWKR